MLYLALFILFAVGAAIGEEEDCRYQMHTKCNISSIPTEIPDTMEDFKRDCKVVTDAIKCIQEQNEKCEVKDFESVPFGKVAQFTETNCDADSSLYQALSRNYECIKPIAKRVVEQCITSKVIDEEDMIKMISKAGGLPEPNERCGSPLFEITCIGSIIGKQCGQEAKEAVTVILQNTKFDFLECNEESILRDLQPLREVFESTLADALEVENAMLKEIKEALAK